MMFTMTKPCRYARIKCVVLLAKPGECTVDQPSYVLAPVNAHWTMPYCPCRPSPLRTVERTELDGKSWLESAFTS